jgi:hypothetical protein
MFEFRGLNSLSISSKWEIGAFADRYQNKLMPLKWGIKISV